MGNFTCAWEVELTAELGDKYSLENSTLEGNFTLENSNFGDKILEISLIRAVKPKGRSKLAVLMMENRDFLQEKN